ncbi:MAG: type II toxin-antitoxin system prevent-host-death family antitoxin [Proteobacteria bacterium]|nr:type II toxin-antitoxin system prevent-host-death family antitoxin [Pseudomonadota bacterium]
MGEQIMNIAEAKKYFSDLIGRVAYRRETITIARRGKPVAKIIPFGPEPAPRHLVEAVGRIAAPPDFHRTMEKIVSGRSKSKPRLLLGKK